jgi:DNA gyrase subunit A
VFAGRESSGVRGIKLLNRDEVISLSVLRHFDASPEERETYVKLANAKRRGGAEDDTEPVPPVDSEEIAGEVTLTPDRVRDLEDHEEMLLTVTDSGFGKRSSSYEYRVTGRGGQGIANITLAPRNGKAVVATFPVHAGDDVMLVTDAGRLIRLPADQVRITGRQAMGVTLFRVDAGEHVTSVFPVLEDDSDDVDAPGADPPDGHPPDGHPPGDTAGGDITGGDIAGGDERPENAPDEPGTEDDNNE